MKLIIILIFVLLTSCSQKQKSKSNFKILLGKTATSMSGGAYVNARDKALNKDNIVKLDGDNSALIPYGTYDLFFVTFDGPEANSGIMHCGSVLNRTFSNTMDTVTVTISVIECANPLYASTILELKKGTTAKWDTDRFDLSHWGN